MKCIYPPCHKEAVQRGLCWPDLMAVYRLIGRKKTNWEKLLQKGKVLPAAQDKYKRNSNGGNNQEREDWFLS